MKSISCVFVAGLFTASGQAATVVVTQKDKAFSQAALVLKAGDSIVFENNDTIAHNVFAASPAATFDLKQQKPGAANTVLFDKPGVVEVRCAIHPRMKLVVTVK